MKRALQTAFSNLLWCVMILNALRLAAWEVTCHWLRSVAARRHGSGDLWLCAIDFVWMAVLAAVAVLVWCVIGK